MSQNKTAVSGSFRDKVRNLSDYNRSVLLNVHRRCSIPGRRIFKTSVILQYFEFPGSSDCISLRVNSRYDQWQY